MTYAPLSAPWIALMIVGLALSIAALDIVAVVGMNRRSPASSFLGGIRRLAWAIGVHAFGVTAIFLITLFAPMAWLYALGSSLGLPEYAGYIISFVGAGVGVGLGMRLEHMVARQLDSPLLTDRQSFLMQASAEKAR